MKHLIEEQINILTLELHIQKSTYVQQLTDVIKQYENLSTDELDQAVKLFKTNYMNNITKLEDDINKLKIQLNE